MIKNYFKIAWRNLIKNKVISSINIVGLATGMTAAVLILIWVQNLPGLGSRFLKEKVPNLNGHLSIFSWMKTLMPVMLRSCLP